MLAPTHAIYGPAIALIILSVFNVEASFHWSVILCAILGSIAPDLDRPSSTIGRLFPPISKYLELRYGHRTLTHSIIGTVAASLSFTLLIGILAWVLRWTLLRSVPVAMSHYGIWLVTLNIWDIVRLGLAFAIGYASHLALDMLTPRGIQLLWPSPNRDIIFQNSFRIETGSKAEVPVAIVGLALLIVSFPLSEYGPMTALRWFLATPEAAIAEFKSSPNRTDIEFEGMWTETKVPVHATAEVLDVKNKRLVIALDPSEAPPKSSPVPATRLRSGLHLRASGKAGENPSPTPLKNQGSRPAEGPKRISPTRSRVVVTLSDELSADISAKKVHLIKTKQKVRIDRYTFKDQTREMLMKRLPTDVLISGVIYLPKGLKVNAAQSLGNDSKEPNSVSGPTGQNQQGIRKENATSDADHNWKAIEQAGYQRDDLIPVI